MGEGLSEALPGLQALGESPLAAMVLELPHRWELGTSCPQFSLLIPQYPALLGLISKWWFLRMSSTSTGSCLIHGPTVGSGRHVHRKPGLCGYGAGRLLLALGKSPVCHIKATTWFLPGSSAFWVVLYHTKCKCASDCKQLCELSLAAHKH